jgi:hypothetical protein
MKKRIKDKWVNALRSGEYKQGRNALMKMGDDGKPAGYCCLGVLCDLYANSKEGKEIGAKWEPSGYLNEQRFLGTTTYLPARVMDWAGLETSNPLIPKGRSGNKTSLAQLNDGEDAEHIGAKTFKQIATVIEKYL